MNLLYVVYNFWPPYFGGELLISIDRFEALIQRGHHVTVFTSGVPGFLPEEEVHGIKIFRSPIVNKSKLGRGIRRLIFPVWVIYKMNQVQFDILHFGGAGGVDVFSSNFANWLVCKIAKSKGAKSVFVHSLADTETEMFSETGLNRYLRKYTLREIDAIVSVSPALQESIQKKYPENAKLITNCIRDDIFLPLSPSEIENGRTNYSLPNDIIIFSFLGSICYRKGFDLLAQSFVKLSPEHPEWFLWIIGPYDKSENQNLKLSNLQQEIRELQKLKNVRFEGRINDRLEIARLMALSDIFVFPTRKEGMPLAPLEAMSAGIPIIISRIPGVTDLANIEGETGCYFEPGDQEGLEKSMVKLAFNQSLRKKMGENARNRIVENFGWKQYVDKWEKLYLGLVDE